MKEAIKDTLQMWKNHVELRNLYNFGDEDVSLAEFSQLFKNTFEIIKTAKNDFIYKNISPEDVTVSLEYLELLTTLSKYMVYDCAEDESADKKFTATCLIAQKLVEYATLAGGYEISGGSVTFFDYRDENRGVFSFDRKDYPFYDCCFDEEDDSETYLYNIYDGNFEEILDLASQL